MRLTGSMYSPKGNPPSLANDQSWRLAVATSLISAATKDRMIGTTMITVAGLDPVELRKTSTNGDGAAKTSSISPRQKIMVTAAMKAKSVLIVYDTIKE